MVGDVEDVIADVLATEFYKEKQRAIAASIEHQLTHNPKSYMCEVCLRCKIQRRRQRKKGVVDMGERPTQLGAQCTGDHLIRQRGLDSEEDAEFEGASSA